MVRVLEAVPMVVVAALVIGPIAREYGDLRRERRLTRLGAGLATLTLLPALAVGLAVAAPFPASPVLQWTTTVVVTIVLYSLAISAVRPALASEALHRSS